MPFRITEKMECSGRDRLKIKLAALVVAFAAVSILILALGYPVFSVYQQMIIGSLGSLYSFQYVLIKMVPLALAGIGAAFAYRMKFWNIGTEGQIMMGAFAAAGIGLFCNHYSRPVNLILMALAAMGMGAVWILIPAVFKIHFGVNETILTLMLNYVASKWITYLQYQAWKDPMAFGFTKIANLDDNAVLPEIGGIHIGFLIMLIAAVLAFILFRYSKLGFKMKIIGESPETAKYLGLKTNRIMFGMVALSGAICGLTGMIQVAGVEHTLNTSISNGVGFSAILVAWLGELHPLFILIAAFLFAALSEGASYLQTAFQIPADIATIIQGIVLFAIIGSDFFTKYRLERIHKDENGAKARSDDKIGKETAA